nr:MAG TPA: hypothetical protein [Caudoviricetes sp.]
MDLWGVELVFDLGLYKINNCIRRYSEVVGT